MSTQIETLAKELIDQMQTEVSRNIVAFMVNNADALKESMRNVEAAVTSKLEELDNRMHDLEYFVHTQIVTREEMNQKFVERSDALSPIVAARLEALEQSYVDNTSLEAHIKRWAAENFEHFFKEAVEEYYFQETLDYKV